MAVVRSRRRRRLLRSQLERLRLGEFRVGQRAALVQRGELCEPVREAQWAGRRLGRGGDDVLLLDAVKARAGSRSRRLRLVPCPQARLVDLPLCRLRRGEGRRLAAEAPALPPAVVPEMVVELSDVALVLAEGVREIGVAPPVARGALGVRVFPLAPFVRRRVEGVGRDGRPVLYGRRNREP